MGVSVFWPSVDVIVGAHADVVHMMMGALEVIVGKSYDTNLVVPVK